MSAAHLTAEEAIESLTGFDELAIAKHFGMEWSDLAEKKPSTFTRALVFVHLTREGRSAQDAKNEVMGMTLGTVQGYFSTEDEPMPEDPITESGKGDG